MDELLHQLASGIALGGVYAIMALALVMIYQATQLINFAQGEMAMFSTYFAWRLLDSGRLLGRFRRHGRALVHWRGGDRADRRAPVRQAPMLASVIIFIGLAFIFNALAGWFFGYSVQSLRHAVRWHALVRRPLYVGARSRARSS